LGSGRMAAPQLAYGRLDFISESELSNRFDSERKSDAARHTSENRPVCLPGGSHSMLCMNSYPEDYIDACRSLLDHQMAAYREVVLTADARTIVGFEARFFSHMVVALDRYFVHRTRGIEGKDGNPLNEVRMLCNSILENEGVLTADKTIKYDPAKTILGLPIGTRIQLREAEFTHLAAAFFNEIEKRFRAG
jgi:hypothetical protein